MTAGKKLAYWITGIVTGLLLAIAIPSCSPFQNVSLRTIPDTRNVVLVLFTPHAKEELKPALDSLAFAKLIDDSGKATGFPEEGRCLYGKVVKHDGHGILFIEHVGEVNEPANATATQVKVTDNCEEFDDDGMPLVGNVHTHPYVLNPDSTLRLQYPGEACQPSERDFQLHNEYDRLLVIYIYCGNGLAYQQLNDSRWWIFKWRD